MKFFSVDFSPIDQSNHFIYFAHFFNFLGSSSSSSPSRKRRKEDRSLIVADIMDWADTEAQLDNQLETLDHKTSSLEDSGVVAIGNNQTLKLSTPPKNRYKYLNQMRKQRRESHNFDHPSNVSARIGLRASQSNSRSSMFVRPNQNQPQIPTSIHQNQNYKSVQIGPNLAYPLPILPQEYLGSNYLKIGSTSRSRNCSGGAVSLVRSFANENQMNTNTTGSSNLHLTNSGTTGNTDFDSRNTSGHRTISGSIIKSRGQGQRSRRLSSLSGNNGSSSIPTPPKLTFSQPHTFVISDNGTLPKKKKCTVAETPLKLDQKSQGQNVAQMSRNNKNQNTKNTFDDSAFFEAALGGNTSKLDEYLTQLIAGFDEPAIQTTSPSRILQQISNSTISSNSNFDNSGLETVRERGKVDDKNANVQAAVPDTCLKVADLQGKKVKVMTRHSTLINVDYDVPKPTKKTKTKQASNNSLNKIEESLNELLSTFDELQKMPLPVPLQSKLSQKSTITKTSSTVTLKKDDRIDPCPKISHIGTLSNTNTNSTVNTNATTNTGTTKSVSKNTSNLLKLFNLSMSSAELSSDLQITSGGTSDLSSVSELTSYSLELSNISASVESARVASVGLKSDPIEGSPEQKQENQPGKVTVDFTKLLKPSPAIVGLANILKDNPVKQKYAQSSADLSRSCSRASTSTSPSLPAEAVNTLSETQGAEVASDQSDQASNENTSSYHEDTTEIFKYDPTSRRTSLYLTKHFLSGEKKWHSLPEVSGTTGNLHCSLCKDQARVVLNRVYNGCFSSLVKN